MSSDLNFVEFITEQLQGSGIITYKKMFGEFAIYCDAKVVGLICNNQFFVKPTESGRKYIGAVNEEAPYKGAKRYFLIEDMLEDRARLSELIAITASELPLPKTKKPKVKKQ